MRSLREQLAWYRAEQYLARYNPYGIAVTGTYGRTLTSEAIFSALKAHRHVRKGYVVEHSIDIPEGILGAQGHAEHRSILRMLTQSKMREITQFEPDTSIADVPLLVPGFAPWALSRILPRMLVMTHVGLEHADLFMNKDMVVHEYGAVAGTLAKDAVIVLNADDKELRTLSETMQHPVLSYGIHPKADVRITRAVRADGGKGLFLEIALHGKHQEIFLPNLFAAQHVSAIAAGVAAAHGMGISLQDAIQGLQKVQPPNGTLSRMHTKRGWTILDDSYDTCPEQLESSLKSFSTLACSGRKIAVVGDMDNLSSFAIESHEAAGKQAATSAPIVVFVGDMMRQAQDAVLKSGMKADTHHFTYSTDAATWLPENVREGDMVFVSGGKSMKMGKIIKALTR